MFNKKFFANPCCSRFLSPIFRGDDMEWDFKASCPSGLTIYEDKTHVVIKAAVPGIPTEQIRLSHHHGYIIIEGEAEKEEADSERKYYRKACQSFVYRVPVPPAADDSQKPQATLKDGVMTITFKRGHKNGKSIPIKKGK